MINRLLRLFYRVYKKYDFITPEEVNRRIEVLERMVKASKPDIVVGVLDGGSFPAKRLSRLLKTSFGTVKIAYYSLSLFNIEFEYFPIIKRVVALLGYKPKVKVIRGLKGEVKGKNVLLVDDECTSGKTIQAAVDEIRKNNPRSIKTAVLNTYEDNPLIDFCPVSVNKEYFFKMKQQIMPWEKISPYYKFFSRSCLI